ncbi:IS4 transposase, partial [mine drainage metagenome]
PWLEARMGGPPSGHHKQLVSVPGMARIEALAPCWQGLPGRPPCERAALARAFVARAVFKFPTTSPLIETRSADKTLRRLCGWQRAGSNASGA